MSQIEVITRYTSNEIGKEMTNFLTKEGVSIDRLIQAVDAEYVRAKIIADQVAKLGNVKLFADGEATTKGSLSLTWQHGKETAPITFARWNKLLSKVFRDFPGMAIATAPEILRPWLAKLSMAAAEVQPAKAPKAPKAPEAAATSEYTDAQCLALVERDMAAVPA